MTAVIILAAGGSRRLGSPKQNLIYEGKTLLRHAVDTAISSVCKPVVVVTGGHAESIETFEPCEGVRFIYNENWAEGMSSSIISGLRTVYDEPGIANVLIMVCDQPYVTPALLNEMVKSKETSGKPVVACAYNHTVGVPALFSRALFDDLFKLKGEHGAKALLKTHRDKVFLISFEKGAVDVDTPQDYDRLKSK